VEYGLAVVAVSVALAVALLTVARTVALDVAFAAIVLSVQCSTGFDRDVEVAFSSIDEDRSLLLTTALIGAVLLRFVSVADAALDVVAIVRRV
jgi:hypothetical protein